MKKRLLAMFLALVMCLAMVPMSALAAEKVEIKWLPGGMEPISYIEETEQILAKNGTAWFLLDKAGNIVKPLGALEFKNTGFFSEGLAYAFQDNGKYGYIDASFQMVIPAAFDAAHDFSEGLAAVHFGDWSTGKWGFIDKTGQLVIQPTYDAVDYTGFSEGLAAVKKGELWGFIDKTGKEVVPPSYNNVERFSEGLARVMVGDYENGKYGFIDKTGKIVLPLEYDDASLFLSSSSFSEGLIWMKKGDTSGYIDKTGKIVIPTNADDFFGGFSEGIAGVQDLDSGTYYIDKTGKVLFRTDGFWGMGVSTFEYGLATKERINEETGLWDRTYINKNGEEIFSEYYNVTILWGPCGFVCNFEPGGEEAYGIFVNPYYNATTQPTQPPATAQPTNDKLSVDGKDATPAAYKIGGANYFMLRDVAMLLNGTKAQFEISYDNDKKAINITTGKAYTPQGYELKTTPQPNATAETSSDAVYIDGEKVELMAYKIGGANFYGIRDLGRALGFNVGWSQGRGMYLESGKPYSDAD